MLLWIETNPKSRSSWKKKRLQSKEVDIYMCLKTLSRVQLSDIYIYIYMFMAFSTTQAYFYIPNWKISRKKDSSLWNCVDIYFFFYHYLAQWLLVILIVNKSIYKQFKDVLQPKKKKKVKRKDRMREEKVV